MDEPLFPCVIQHPLLLWFRIVDSVVKLFCDTKLCLSPRLVRQIRNASNDEVLAARQDLGRDPEWIHVRARRIQRSMRARHDTPGLLGNDYPSLYQV